MLIFLAAFLTTSVEISAVATEVDFVLASLVAFVVTSGEASLVAPLGAYVVASVVTIISRASKLLKTPRDKTVLCSLVGFCTFFPEDSQGHLFTDFARYGLDRRRIIHACVCSVVYESWLKYLHITS